MIEYNCRFGDPETQAVLPLLETDLLTVMEAVTAGRLAEVEVKWAGQVQLLPYPGQRRLSQELQKGLRDPRPRERPPARRRGRGLPRRHEEAPDGTLVTNGGRVLGLSVTAPDAARGDRRGLRRRGECKLENMHYRRDIGARALAATEG